VALGEAWPRWHIWEGQTQPNNSRSLPHWPSASAWVSQIGRVFISSSPTTTTSPIEDYADCHTPAVPTPAANVVLVRPPANERRSNLERPPHPSCGLPQTQASPSVHRQLQRGPGGRSRRRNPRSHRHRGHSPTFNRIPSDIANQRLLHLLSAACLFRPSPNQGQGRRRSSGQLICKHVNSNPPSSTQEAQEGARRRDASLCQKTNHKRRAYLCNLEAMGIDKRRRLKGCMWPSCIDVIAQSLLTGAYFPRPQSPNDHPSCDDKEGHYIIVPDDMIARRCEF